MQPLATPSLSFSICTMGSLTQAHLPSQFLAGSQATMELVARGM